MSDLQISPEGRRGSKHGLSSPMQAMFVDNGDEIEGVVHVDVEEVDAFYNVAWKHHGKKLKVPGYRPGKAPRAAIERVHGKKIQELVTMALMDDFYKRSVQRFTESPPNNPKLFYDKPATFGERFKFSFVIPKPKGFGQVIKKSEDEKPERIPIGHADGHDAINQHSFNLEEYIRRVEPPDVSKVVITRVTIDVSDQEIEERFEEYRRSYKMNDDEIAQHLKLSSATELPRYFKDELKKERSELTDDLLFKQAIMMIIGESAVIFNGKRMEIAEMIKIATDKDEESRGRLLSFSAAATFCKIAEREGMEKELADAKKDTITIEDLMWLVMKRVILKKAIIKEKRFESWAKAEEFIRRSEEQ